MTLQLRQEIYGDGDDVYLGIHGWGGSLTTFAPLLSFLPDNASLYTVSMPGYGGSPKPVNWTLDDAVDMLLHTVEPLRSEPVTLVGSCSGAIFGLLALERKGIRVRRLVMLDAFAYIPWYLRILLTPVLGRLFYWSSFGNPLGRWLTNLSLLSGREKETAAAEQAEGMVDSFADIDHVATYETLRLLDAVGPYTRFGPLIDADTPVDILIGAKSFRAIHHSAELWQEMWKQAQIHVIGAGGHLLIDDAPADVATLVWGPSVTCR